MAALVTDARAKLHPACAAMDPLLLTQLLAGASEWMEEHCHRVFLSAELAEVHSGDGTDVLFLNKLPITALKNVVILDDDGVTTTTIDDADFRYDPATGELRFAPTVVGDWTYFPQGFRNITPTYTAGWTVIPGPVQEAVIEVAIAMAAVGASVGNPAMQSETMGAYSYTLKDLASGAFSLLNPTTRQTIAYYVLHGRGE